MQVLLIIGLLLAAILILVVIHEFGHYLAARVFRVRVRRFSFGLGKPLWTLRQKNETEWIISTLPLGGYIQLHESRGDCKTEKELAGAFFMQPLPIRGLIIFAGPLASMLFGYLFFIATFWIGLLTYSPVVENVTPHSMAAEMLVTPADRIERINGRLVRNWMEANLLLLQAMQPDGVLIIDLVTPSDKRKILQIDAKEWMASSKENNLFLRLGIQAQKQQQNEIFLSLPFDEAVSYGGHTYYLMTKTMLIILKRLVTGEISLQQLGGPLMIAITAKEAAEIGLGSFLAFLAILSVNLALINLLPLPGLDGGQLLFLALEKIRGRPIPQSVQLLGMRLTIAFAVILIGHLIANDISYYSQLHSG